MGSIYFSFGVDIFEYLVGPVRFDNNCQDFFFSCLFDTPMALRRNLAHPPGMININATLVVQVILFLITLFFLNRLLIRPIMKVVQNRTRFFQEAEDKILSLEKETEELKRRFSQLQIDARKDAFSESDRLKKAGNTQAGEYMDQSKDEAASIRAEGETKAEAEKEKERPFLKDQAAVLSGDIVEKLIERRI